MSKKKIKMPESIDIMANGLKSKQNQTTSAILIEFNLDQPTSKTKSKQILFTLLTSLNINDEFDINSINYLNGYDFASISSSNFFNQNNTNNLVEKISIQFKCPNGKLFRINYLIYFYFFCLLFLKKIT
jgi:hypothetical protein